MIRRGLLIAGLVAALVGAVPAAPAQAQPYCGVVAECAYYTFDSATHTQLIGWLIYRCDGTVDTWGTMIGYRVYAETPCDVEPLSTS